MSVTIDLYDFKKQLARNDEALMDWVHEHGYPKDAYVLDYDANMPEELREALREASEGQEWGEADSVMVVVQ